MLENKLLQETLFHQKDQIEAWLQQQWQLLRAPFYSSVDIRNAHYKIAPVDTNLFPAGFNNLGQACYQHCVQSMKMAMQDNCPDAKRVLIVPESHSRNTRYFENIAALQEIIQGAGYDVRIGMLPGCEAVTSLALPSGAILALEPLQREGDRIGVSGFFPRFVLLNNDLTAGIPDILKGITQTLLPALELGWCRRLKSEHFGYYDTVAHEFAALLDLDPWLINPFFETAHGLNFMKSEGQECLLTKAEGLFARISQKYEEYNIKENPFVVIKADAGTYGMAVMVARSVDDLRKLNRKQRTRMAKGKGGSAVDRVIIQEGVYTHETSGEENLVAEPVVYSIGNQVVGGFYRVHNNKAADENLNAPGMNFHPLSFQSDCLKTQMAENHTMYMYSVVARLAAVAASRELEAFRGEGR